MLKALELLGFKSFADKTRFEFPAGITVVVGPNGSGKCNIVDAIKWVLGEQAAKSLRGKEMADVIFKGSGTSGRKPMNTAEATLVFDNADRRLPIDAPEVHITRRVYRSGEGEYLINRQPARLKDIRDLFRGTGVGADAYSLIEQGKVDRLLQASAKDRRAIFEEAAGISRFKAKKVEAQRRLERVEQNLLRLSDIVEEVENRLKTVRAQAGKARRYREYSERLQAAAHAGRPGRLAAAERAARRHRERAGRGRRADRSRPMPRRSGWKRSSSNWKPPWPPAARSCATARTDCAFARQQLAQQQATIDHERTRAAGAGRRSAAASAESARDERQGRRRPHAPQSDASGSRRRRQGACGRGEGAGAARIAASQTIAARVSIAARRQVEAGGQQYVAQLQAAAALASQVEAGESQLAAVQQSVMQHAAAT